jgi:DNA-binding beta-propeller fold protein YncE
VAPEQIRGDDVDGRADVYALGCVLYEMLTGEVPFRRTTAVATLFAHLEEDPTPPCVLRPDLPPAVDAAVARALAKKADARPATWGRLVEEVRLALGLGAPAPRRRWVPVAALLIAVLVAALLAVVRPLEAAPEGALRLWRLDAATSAIRAVVDLPFPPRSVAAGSGLVWITDPLGDAVVPVDPGTGAVPAPVPVGRGPAGVAVGAGSVWVANAVDGTVSRIDPAARRVVGTTAVGAAPHELAADGDGVWVTTNAG